MKIWPPRPPDREKCWNLEPIKPELRTRFLFQENSVERPKWPFLDLSGDILEQADPHQHGTPASNASARFLFQVMPLLDVATWFLIQVHTLCAGCMESRFSRPHQWLPWLSAPALGGDYLFGRRG